LGFKASNLTNRWIVAKWPYKYIRHPAYLAKNFARALWALPIIILTIKDFEILKLLFIILSTILRFTIYYFRAKTEEEHLSQDKDYQEYKKKVKYKFIPKVF
jgi:protein-S-isoprenylcysteine O-methyltransferase Ste14